MPRHPLALLAALALAASCSASSGSDSAKKSSRSLIPPPDIPTASFEVVNGEPCWEGVCRPTIYGDGDGDGDDQNFVVASENFATELMVVWVPPAGTVDDDAYFVAADGQVSVPTVHDSGKAVFVRTPPGSTPFAELVNGDSRCGASGGTSVTHFEC